MQPITPYLIEQAKLMRMEHASWFRIAKALDVSEYVMRCALDPAYRRYKREEWARKTNPNRRPKINHATHRIVHSHTHLAPPEVLAERELVQELALKPRSITSELLGDPLPGRSALDRQRK